MSQFLERNKKKGAGALLLLFLQRGKGVGPLVLLVALLAFMFIAPSDFIMKVPFVGRIARALGLRSDLGGGGMSAGRLEDSMNMARGLDDPGLLSRGQGVGGGMGHYGKSTVDYVKNKDAGSGDAKTYDDVAGAAGKSVDGVVRPEDGAKMEDGVALKNDELVNGLTGDAYAGMIGGGAGASKAGFEPMKGLGGGFGNNSSMGSRPLDRSADLVKQSLGADSTPRVGDARTKGSSGGKLSRNDFRKISARVSGAVGDNRGAGRKTVMYQLVEGRVYSIAAAPPPGKCDPNGNCPGEYAKNIAGTVFDGSQTKAGIIAAEALGDPTTPNIPSNAEIGKDIQDAKDVEEAARKCEEANDKYGPQMDASSDAINTYSQELNRLNCSSSASCQDRGRIRQCLAIGDKMKAECRNSNRISQEWANACPLTDGGKFDKMNCNQG